MNFMMSLQAKDCTKASFSVPSHGLFLVSVEYPSDYFQYEQVFILVKPLLICISGVLTFYFKKDLAGDCRYISLRPALKIKRLVL